jgi:hypothetical protein
MSRQRVQAGAGLSTPSIRPVASPVEPAQYNPSAGSKLSQLARGLSTLAPELARYGQDIGEREATQGLADGDRAMRAYMEESEKHTYESAIADGLIRPDQSPWFRLGAQRTAGRAMARRYESEFRTHARENLEHLTDLNEYRAAESEFRRGWLTENVGEKRTAGFEEGFGVEMDNRVHALEQGFITGAGAKTRESARAAFHSFQYQWAIDAAEFDDVPLEEIARFMTEDANGQRSLGMSDTEVDETMIEAVMAAASALASQGMDDAAARTMGCWISSRTVTGTPCPPRPPPARRERQRRIGSPWWPCVSVSRRKSPVLTRRKRFRLTISRS